MSKEKKVLFVLMPNDFQDKEFLEPYTLLLKEGYKVDVAGLSCRKIAVGMLGLEHHPNKILTEMSTKDFDTYEALVIPGGTGSPDYLWDNEELQDIVRYFYENDKIVATICYACIVPVQAEILTNKKATVYPTQEAKNILEEHDVIFSNEGVVVLEEEHLITSQGPTHATAFAQQIVAQLKKLPTSKNLYKQQNYYDFNKP